MEIEIPQSILISVAEFGEIKIYNTLDYISVEGCNLPDEETIYKFISSKDSGLGYLLRDAPYGKIGDKVFASTEKGWKKVIIKNRI